MSDIFSKLLSQGEQQGQLRQSPPPPAVDEKPADAGGSVTLLRSSSHDTKPPRHRDVTVSRYHDTTVEFIRKSVKEFGKEAATHRFTLAEKRALATIVHTLHMQGIRTTENEITRIAVNFVVDEFSRQQNDSLLGLVLKALKQ